MQCSYGYKDLKLTIKYTNKDNYFSIAKKINDNLKLHKKYKKKGINTISIHHHINKNNK